MRWIKGFYKRWAAWYNEKEENSKAAYTEQISSESLDALEEAIKVIHNYRRASRIVANARTKNNRRILS